MSKVSVFRCKSCGRVAVLNDIEVTVGPGRCRDWQCEGDLELMLRCSGTLTLEGYEGLRLAALNLLSKIIPITGSDVLLAVSAKDIKKLAEAAGFKE